MTTPPPPELVAPREAAVSEATGRSGRRAWLLVVLVVLAALGGGGAWWFTHPAAFYAGGVSGTSSAQAHVGEPITFGSFALPDRALTLRSAQARIKENSADATVTVVLCLPRSSYVGITRNQTTSDLCKRSIPIDGARVYPAGKRLVPELIVQITPRRAGTVTVRGLRVGYRDGLRSGSQDLSRTLVVTAAP